ncbi:hypothetical protein [Actinomadura harenae]|uniref:Uncharacterized protein n=1 Tax=Actinomadura harenae TaxID=2483351 RepID=A0A3M2LUP6_9ACTN|nr:hypothetical protein [Actinomadura harenae]RMI40826.1 hypothetical protein EBO15_25275 [Actinomadura harenae]
MERLEQAAWPMAGGVLTVFVLAVVLKSAPWPWGYAAVAVAVGTFAARVPLLAAAGLGVAGWAFATGFDVRGSGDLGVSGSADAWRLAGLLAVGLAATLTASARAWAGAPGPAGRRVPTAGSAVAPRPAADAPVITAVPSGGALNCDDGLRQALAGLAFDVPPAPCGCGSEHPVPAVPAPAGPVHAVPRQRAPRSATRQEALRTPGDRIRRGAAGGPPSPGSSTKETESDE